MGGHHIVIINHWGGIPYAVQQDLVSGQEWTLEGYTNSELTHTDEYKQFETLTCDVWMRMKSAGFRTVCLGPGFCEQQNVVNVSDRLTNPYEMHQGKGIDVCSPFPSTAYQGRSSVHDMDTLREAIRILDEECDVSLFMWVNLCSCRDVVRMRFKHCITNSEHCLVRANSDSVDPRHTPLSLGTSLPIITSRHVEENRLRFGEDTSSDTSSKQAQITHGEYSKLLSISKDILGEQREEMNTLVDNVLSRGGDVGMTATHSISLGEQGIRDGNAPTLSCTNTFWCSSSNMNATNTPSLKKTLYNFLSRVCGVECECREDVSVCTSVIGSTDYYRVVLRINDHKYVCIGDKTCVLCVFDTNEDPCETQNILSNITHIMPHIDKVFLSSIHGLKAAKLVKPPSMKILSIDTPPEKEKFDVEIVKESMIINSTHSATSVTEESSQIVSRKQALRRKEKLLSSRHR